MSIKETYSLKFSKIVSRGYSDFYDCDWKSEIPGSVELGTLLQTLANEESEVFLEELNLVLSGEDYEEYYAPDSVTDVWVDFVPPNALISGTFTIPLIDLKELLEDWIEYTQL